jgi:hypothetical protein
MEYSSVGVPHSYGLRISFTGFGKMHGTIMILLF